MKIDSMLLRRTSSAGSELRPVVTAPASRSVMIDSPEPLCAPMVSSAPPS
jgi:hypothetical protein